jgi:hypothetical protein
MKVVLVLGSGPNVITARGWDRALFNRIVAINNAWRVRDDWDDLIFPWDFPPDRRPLASPGKNLITQEKFVPAQNAYGGFVYAGGTMAFTAAYWALHTHKPQVMAFMGCDMHYPAGQTHFYGTGTADPLRQDITLQSLEAKSARLMVMAAQQGCAMVNLSDGPSRLIFPRSTPDTLAEIRPQPFDTTVAAETMAQESMLNYYDISGRYWEDLTRFDPRELRRLDALWMRAATSAGPCPKPLRGIERGL